ncbi:hypothetical protein BKA70DRAFT_1370669 [Coprinopsis sp. MPI-PUGE-AT-0042]|nr:hypothetical protein BKA70DRAFT_1370669 [Coprinopsis sp. MPI-PUGE-AT-0042]
MGNPSNIRNITVISKGNDRPGGDHAGSTLVDCLVSHAGITPAADVQDGAETRPSLSKPITNPLYFQLDDEQASSIQKGKGNDFLINLVECNGTLDLSPVEVVSAIRVADGALVVVDCTNHVTLETERALRLALLERVKPTLVLSKMDSLLFTEDVDKESVYQSLYATIESFNAIVSTLNGGIAGGDFQVCPSQGNIAFTSGLQGWGFTLRQFAIRYARKFGVDQSKVMKKLWGDSYFDPATRKWGSSNTNAAGEPLSRGFNMFILDPIVKVFNVVTNSDRKTLSSILEKLNVRLLQHENTLEGTALLKIIMHRFLPLENSILEMVVLHLPSPVTAQVHRVGALDEGPVKDDTGAAIRDCDASGPLVLFVSRAVATSDKGRFYAFGRIFSGTVKAGQQIRIQGHDYVPGRRADWSTGTVESTLFTIGRHVTSMQEVTAGNLLALTLVDKPLLESSTLTTSETSRNIRSIKSSVHPIMQVSVEVEKPSHLPRLVEGMGHLSIRQPSARTWVAETGEYMIAGVSEPHVGSCIKDLQEHLADIPLVISQPYVSYRETIKDESTIVALAKSPNKHNRIYGKASPLGDLTGAIENGTVSAGEDFKMRARTLVEEFGWEDTHVRKIWCFGPDRTGPNLLVDVTSGVQFLHEIKDSVVTGFRWATTEGVLCEESVRGVRINIMDTTLMGSAIHRGGGQIIPMARRMTYAASLLATPAIQEPMYIVELQCPEPHLSTAVLPCLQQRDGRVISEKRHLGTGTATVKAYLPVAKSFGFEAQLRSRTVGQASMHAVFDHWETLPGCPLDKGSTVEELVMSIRRRKGLKPEIPPLETYYDKL